MNVYNNYKNSLKKLNDFFIWIFLVIIGGIFICQVSLVTNSLESGYILIKFEDEFSDEFYAEIQKEIIKDEMNEFVKIEKNKEGIYLVPNLIGFEEFYLYGYDLLSNKVEQIQKENRNMKSMSAIIYINRSSF